MAMVQHLKNGQVSLSSLRSLIVPSAWGASERAAKEGIPISNIDLAIDFARDELQLLVTHTLFNRAEIDVKDWKSEIGPRLMAAMRLFHRMPAAKALCVDRRRLSARGEKARKEANRPIRKLAKRRFA